MTATDTAHILIDEESTAWIDDTNVKVIEVVLSHQAHGWTPEEICRQHPHLSLAQIYAALAYYHDHRAALDAQIDQRAEFADKMRAESQREGDSPIRKRLQAKGLLR